MTEINSYKMRYT